MTSTNRTLNRVILLLLGVVALAGGAALALPLLPAVTAWIGIPLLAWIPPLPDLTDPTVLWILAAGLVAVLVLAVAWIATRGRGRTSRAIDADGIVVDDTALAGILRAELDASPDVLSVAAQGYRRAGGAVLVNVQTRSRANLLVLLTQLRAAVATADTTLGADVPLVIHVTTGLRTAMSTSRVAR
ncbi:hypothetical protein [Microbacterium sp. CJ88]|uniref:hypothetical protein n=1 Tax=Microbacterium sp. CJ88 TaxID=3445672 RepID=UPI003F65F3EC